MCNPGSLSTQHTFHSSEVLHEQWQSPDTAPRDGCTFIANVGMPWAVVAMWNEAMEQFCWADLQGNLFQGKNDPAFVNEWESPQRLLGWMPLPDVPARSKKEVCQ